MSPPDAGQPDAGQPDAAPPGPSQPDWLGDYQRLLERRGRVPFDGWSSVVASGSDAATLLNNFCTQDIPKLAVGDACEAFFPNTGGRVLAFGWVWKSAESTCRVVLGSGRANVLAEHLDRYVIREDVTLTVSDEPLSLAWSSDGAGDGSGDGSIGDAVPLPAFGEGARLSLGTPSPSDAIAAAAFEAFRIEQRVPLDGADTDDTVIPQEVDRNATAISFTKGCYLGQETVARLDALGRVKRKLRLLRLGGDAAPGDELTVDGKAAGRVTSVSWSPKHRSVIALAYVKDQHTAVGTRLSHAAGSAEVLADG
ncbi:MAG: glycine cleavage T C-terminal barrel domain-containing protein [Planctomycetota bacterium]